MSYKEKTEAALSCKGDAALTCRGDATLFYWEKRNSELLKDATLICWEDTTLDHWEDATMDRWEDAALHPWEKCCLEPLREMLPWTFKGNAALVRWDKCDSNPLRETQLWSVERNATLIRWEKCSSDPLIETQTCVLQFDGGDAAFRLVKGRRLQNAAFEASYAGSFNAKLALTVGDMCHWDFPEQNSCVSSKLNLIFA